MFTIIGTFSIQFGLIGVSGYCLLSSVRANQDPAYFRLPEPLILFTNKSVAANEESVIQ